MRRWMRQWSTNIRQVVELQEIERIRRQAESAGDCWDYILLAELSRQYQLDSEAVAIALRGGVAEVLFDIVQAIEIATLPPEAIAAVEAGNLEGCSLNCLKDPKAGFSISDRPQLRPARTSRFPYTWMLSVPHLQQYTQKAWQEWLSYGLFYFSPNEALVPVRRDRLQRVLATEHPRLLEMLLGKKRPLRELACILGMPTFSLARILAPSIRNRDLEAIAVADICISAKTTPKRAPAPPLEEVDTASRSQGNSSPYSSPCSSACSSPCIASIDSSPLYQSAIEGLVTACGCRYLGILSARDAIAHIVAEKPDAIFLDALVAGGNGYELCSQIRQIKRFRDTPIILLTDNAIERWRGRLVGATECLTKPFTEKSIRALLQKYKVIDSSASIEDVEPEIDPTLTWIQD